jgi:arginine deiminase
VIVAYERNEATNAKLARAGSEVHAIAGQGARPRSRRRPLHDLPNLP